MSGFLNPGIRDSRYFFQGQFPDREILKIPDYREFKILLILAEILVTVIRILAGYYNFDFNMNQDDS